jgi:hypothetical protein
MNHCDCCCKYARCNCPTPSLLQACQVNRSRPLHLGPTLGLEANPCLAVYASSDYRPSDNFRVADYTPGTRNEKVTKRLSECIAPNRCLPRGGAICYLGNREGLLRLIAYYGLAILTANGNREGLSPRLNVLGQLREPKSGPLSILNNCWQGFHRVRPVSS